MAKKVYCKDCRYYQSPLPIYGIDRCKMNCIAYPTKRTAANRLNNCPSYKRKWYKFWLK